MRTIQMNYITLYHLKKLVSARRLRACFTVLRMCGDMISGPTKQFLVAVRKVLSHQPRESCKSHNNGVVTVSFVEDLNGIFSINFLCKLWRKI